MCGQFLPQLFYQLRVKMYVALSSYIFLNTFSSRRSIKNNINSHMKKNCLQNRYKNFHLSGLPIVASYTPDQVAIVSGLCEVGVIMGMVLGPSIGSGFYFWKGYYWPFVFLAIAQTAFLIGFVLCMPARVKDEKEEDETDLKSKKQIEKENNGNDGTIQKAEDILPQQSPLAFLKLYLSEKTQSLTMVTLGAICVLGFSETGLKL